MALKHHPFGVEAFFRRSLVLTYALPAEALEPLLGPGLVLDRYRSTRAVDEEFGFVAIALVETRELRPKGFPPWLGRSFFLSGTRIFARFERPGKPSMRGLKILRSDTDKWAMSRLGNVFTHYNYALSDVTTEITDSRYEVRVKSTSGEGDLHVLADLTSLGEAGLPSSSVFETMEAALHFAGPLPFTFSYDEESKKMVVIKGLRKSWGPKAISVNVREAAFLDAKFPGIPARLSNAFYVENIPYAWKPGTLEDLAESP